MSWPSLPCAPRSHALTSRRVLRASEDMLPPSRIWRPWRRARTSYTAPMANRPARRLPRIGSNHISRSSPTVSRAGRPTDKPATLESLEVEAPTWWVQCPSTALTNDPRPLTRRHSLPRPVSGRIPQIARCLPWRSGPHASPGLPGANGELVFRTLASATPRASRPRSAKLLSGRREVSGIGPGTLPGRVRHRGSARPRRRLRARDRPPHPVPGTPWPMPWSPRRTRPAGRRKPRR